MERRKFAYQNRQSGNKMTTKTTDAIRRLLSNSKLDSKAMRNKALNAYLQEYFRVAYSQKTHALVKCPNCKNDSTLADKTWKYSVYLVQVYTCKNCKTKYRVYIHDGKQSFVLRFRKGKGYIRA